MQGIYGIRNPRPSVVMALEFLNSGPYIDPLHPVSNCYIVPNGVCVCISPVDAGNVVMTVAVGR